MRSRRCFSLAVVVLLVALMIGCNDGRSSGTVAVTDSAGVPVISMTLPAGWDEGGESLYEFGDDEPLAVFSADDESPVATVAVYSVDDEDGDIAETVANRAKSPDAPPLFEAFSIDGEAAFVEGFLSGEIIGRRASSAHDGVAYDFFFAAEEQDESRVPEFREMLNSLVWE